MDLLPYYTRVPTYEDLAEFLELESNIFQDYSQPRTNSYDAQDQFDDDKRWNDSWLHEHELCRRENQQEIA